MMPLVLPLFLLPFVAWQGFARQWPAIESKTWVRTLGLAIVALGGQQGMYSAREWMTTAQVVGFPLVDGHERLFWSVPEWLALWCGMAAPRLWRGFWT